MSQLTLFDEAAPPSPACCPSCHEPLTAGRTCWQCCDRLCQECNQSTGSAFIEVCWSCWYRSETRDLES